MFRNFVPVCTGVSGGCVRKSAAGQDYRVFPVFSLPVVGYHCRMTDAEAYKELLYQYEILRARLAIREHYLQTIVREVYENIGQVLSLVRVQLALLHPDAGNVEKEKIDSSGKLVGSAIRDLRSLCLRFQPETHITGTAGFSETIEKEITSIYPGAMYRHGPEKYIPAGIENGKALILFNLLLEVLHILRENEHRQLVAAGLNHLPGTVEFFMEYTGEPVNAKRTKLHPGRFDLSVMERVKLLGGYLHLKNRNDKRKIKLVIPIN